MHLIVGEIASAERDSSKKNSALASDKKMRFMEKRRNKYDRRKSVRDGVFVSLSYKNDRRVLRNRRKPGS